MIKFAQQIADTVKKHELYFEEDDAEPEDYTEAEMQEKGLYVNNCMTFNQENDRLISLSKRSIINKLYDNFVKQANLDDAFLGTNQSINNL